MKRLILVAALLVLSFSAQATNEYQAWRGAAEPAASSPSGNEYQAWRGAVEPTAPAGGGGAIQIFISTGF